MKNLKKGKLMTSIFLLSLLLCAFQCEDDIYSSRYKPISIKRTDFNNAVGLVAMKPQEIMGKIYVKDHFLLINEPNLGFHIYNNSDPSNPVKIKFLKVPGSSDVAIKSDVLYINSAVDLIALTFNDDFSDVIVTKRVKNVFPEMLSPDGDYANIPEDEIVVNWILK